MGKVTITEMQEYGYSNTQMHPLSKEEALEVWEQNKAQIYLLHPDNTESAVEEKEAIEKAPDDMLFGVENEDM